MAAIPKGYERAARRLAWVAAAALLAVPAVALADPGFTLKTTVTIPGNPLNSFDISWVDPQLHAYLLADRSNRQVDVIDTATNKFQQALLPGQFAGNVPGCAFSNACNGPNGVLSFYNPASGRHEVWAGDGPVPGPSETPSTSCTARIPLASLTPADTQCSTVKVIDLVTGTLLHNIPTGGQYRADELCYDPADHLIQIANDSDVPPYVNFIPTQGPQAYTVVKQVNFDGKPGDGPNATNGIEQCQWIPENGMIYRNVPEVNGDGNDDAPGQVVIFDPRTMDIVNQFVVPLDQCAGPQGMAVGPPPQILEGCNAKGPPETPSGCSVSGTCTGSGPQNAAVIDARNGNVIATLANQGGNDEVWFNPGNGLYFLAEGSNAAQEQLGVVNSFIRINLVQDIVVASPPGTGRAHSVAADPFTGEVYFPIPSNVETTGNQDPCPTPSSGCVAIYAPQQPRPWPWPHP
jgi:hypothetical protein